MADTVVLIVNYDGGASLARCVASVLAQREPAPEVVVIDNASSDGSADDLPASVRLIRRSTNGGYAVALQDGLDATTAPFVLTLNPDVVLLEDALARAERALEADLLLGSVALRALRAADPERIDATGIGLTSAMGQINWDHGRREADLSPEPVEVLGPLGGAALCRRIAIERAGGFALHYFLYWEDMDLALRIQRAGYRCRTVPDARVLHEGSASVGRWSRTNVYYMVRNHWPCLVATLPGPVLRRRAGAVALAPVRASVLYALRGRPLTALAGLIAGLLGVPAALARRRRLARSGSQAKVSERLEALIAAADEARLAMKAASR